LLCIILREKTVGVKNAVDAYNVSLLIVETSLKGVGVLDHAFNYLGIGVAVDDDVASGGLGRGGAQGVTLVDEGVITGEWRRAMGSNIPAVTKGNLEEVMESPVERDMDGIIVGYFAVGIEEDYLRLVDNFDVVRVGWDVVKVATLYEGSDILFGSTCVVEFRLTAGVGDYRHGATFVEGRKTEGLFRSMVTLDEVSIWHGLHWIIDRDGIERLVHTDC
jgi:hypothetical protein